MPIVKSTDRRGSRLEGAPHTATISLILDHSEPGQGPQLHRHPYDETWVVQEGPITFELGEDRVNAGPGDIVIAPPGVPHKFTNHGLGRSSLVCIHASPTIIGERLE